MTGKEMLFCQLISCASSPREAAYRAGFHRRPLKKADALLSRRDITDTIAALNRTNASRTGKAESGLRRLAFGSIDDAVRLLFCEDEMPEEPLDLYQVSEIKKGKNGVEIKFFDRQRALEKLLECAEKPDDQATPLYQALEQSAELLRRDHDAV